MKQLFARIAYVSPAVIQMVTIGGLHTPTLKQFQMHCTYAHSAQQTIFCIDLRQTKMKNILTNEIDSLEIGARR